MTIGELARLFNEEFGIGADLEISRSEVGRGRITRTRRVRRGSSRHPTSRRSTAPSSIPAWCCWRERRCRRAAAPTRPFELVGAPGIDPTALAGTLNALHLPGVHFRPAAFEPTFQKHAGRPCGGCQIHVTDRRAFRPVLTGAAVIAACRRAAPDVFGWRRPPYEYEHERMPIDILAGSEALRRALDAGRGAADIAADWEPALARLRADQAALSAVLTADSMPADATIASLGAALRAGRVTAAALLEQCLAAIEERDPTLNAFITVLADDARGQARAADAELSAGRDRGPLHGIRSR